MQTRLLLHVVLLTLTLFSSQLSAIQLPTYLVIPDILESSEINFLHQLTDHSHPEYQWYGRLTYWHEVFEAELASDGATLLFGHEYDTRFLPLIDKLATHFLNALQKLGVDFNDKRIVLESYLDRNVVNQDNASTSGMFWHRDSIRVDDAKKTADYSMILLMNKNDNAWEGGDLVLQQGGHYYSEGSYAWVSSDHPTITIKPAYQQAVIFRNSDSGHMVTPLTPLSRAPVSRDVFITTVYFETKNGSPTP